MSTGCKWTVIALSWGTSNRSLTKQTKSPAHPREPLDGEKSLVLFMPWCSVSFTDLLTSREKPTVWLQMILSGYLLTRSEQRTHYCTEITKDKNVQIQETMCSRYSIQTRLSLIPVCVGFSYLHFLCACKHIYSLICDHIWKGSLCGFFTQWILLFSLECWDNKDKIRPFFPGLKPENQSYFPLVG